MRNLRSASLLLSASLLGLPASSLAQGGVVGRLSVVDQGNRQARDVAQAVVWLESSREVSTAVTNQTVIMSDKEFQPHVVVTTVGSQLSFPNEDPFNHNAFSRSRMGEFDLGLYGRGDARSTSFAVAGVYRIYCNVHPRMSAIAVVRDSPYFTQPGADGSFVIEDVPAGVYTLVAWHERAGEVRQNVEVSAGQRSSVTLELDARGFEPEEHLNKYGRPYAKRGRRY